jgi:AcrR family transcriptional regulator
MATPLSATDAFDAADDADTPLKLDGRRERSAESRRRILAATIALVDHGNPQPTAEQIAAEAQVSLRSVFRHFEDMETLQLEIANEVNRLIAPSVSRPYVTTAWPDVLDEVVERRGKLFDELMRFKIALEMHRYRSDAVAAQLRRLAALQRDLLLARVPASVRDDVVLAQALTALFSMETWHRLREIQGLSFEEATAVWTRMARALVA